MRTSTRTSRAALALAAGSMLFLAGCSSTPSGSTGSAAPPASASSAPAAAGASSAMSVTATETEFSIDLSQSTFAPGDYTFTVVNDGKFAHNLTIEGPGVDKTATATVEAGQSAEITATLQAGTYELFCAIPGHKDKGMDLKITVA